MNGPVKKNVLFICDNNRSRSPTAEYIFNNNVTYSEKYSAKSAGIYEESMKQLTEELLLWADMIFVFEKDYIREIMKRFPKYRFHAMMVNLDIPDVCYYMDPELIYLIREKTKSHLQL